MRKPRVMLALLAATALAAPILAAGCFEPAGWQAYQKAQGLRSKGMLTMAAAQYEKAYGLYMEEGKPSDAARARAKAQSVMFIQQTYPLTRAEVENQLAEMYPQVPAAERVKWVASGELEHMTWDGKVHYFAQAAENIVNRHYDVAHMNSARSQMLAQLIRNISSTCEATGSSWQPYSNPLTWLGTESVSVPRDRLPKTGLLKVWLPLPVVTGPQNAVTLVSVSPEAWLKQPPSINGALSDAYFEVPLDKLAGDLNISVRFQFTHYQENFKVDPANVGAYDKKSDLYKQYTRSYGNTYISPEIRETARKVTGGEKNPYLAAKKLYDYILKEIKYSYMPHAAMWPRGLPESVYVHEMRRGDCGAQAIYFAAMCRSLGIPARTTGGWQLFTGNFAGHFWAEFYLPNYGWVPVDPTAADTAYWTDQITEQERRAFQEFYFGNQDPLRCNVQLDVDERAVPALDGQPVIPVAMQDPTGSCSTMKEPVSAVLSEYQTKSAQLISGKPIPVLSGPMH